MLKLRVKNVINALGQSSIISMDYFAPIFIKAWRTLIMLATNLFAKIASETRGISAKTICFINVHAVKGNARQLLIVPQ